MPSALLPTLILESKKNIKRAQERGNPICSLQSWLTKDKLNISRDGHYSRINTLWRVNHKCLKEQDIFSLGPEYCVYLGVPDLQSFALSVKPWATVVIGHWSYTSGVLSLLKCYMAVGLRFCWFNGANIESYDSNLDDEIFGIQWWDYPDCV